MSIKQFIPPIILTNYARLIKRKVKKYNLGQYEISIPPNFALPNFQKRHKLYDRFLPVLAQNIDSNNTIIDIGANIGDTTIALIQHCKNPIICIEPSDIFLPYLKKNLESINSRDSNRIKVLNEFVGTGSVSGVLDHTVSGTASLKIVDSSNVVTHRSLDNLLGGIDDIILLKVDIDGYDFDAINSAERILSTSEPILFWENEISEDFQFEGYSKMYDMLEKKGYKYIYIFDNFGNIISSEVGFSTLRNINSYLYSMRVHNCTKTIDYTDILATTEKNYTIVQKTIQQYKNDWIEK